MAIYEMTKDRIQKVDETTFSNAGVRERTDIQRLLRDQIAIVCPDTLVIAEEFCNWDDSRRRIDLLAIDKRANLVVIELKRTEDGGHLELQALRYAAMVSAMTFSQAVEAYRNYTPSHRPEQDPQEALLNFLEWDEPNEEAFAQDVRIVLVSAEFSKEITTSVIWLNERDLDIRCVRLRPYKLEDRTLIDVQQVIPLPEAAQYQVQIREKKHEERKARTQDWDETSFFAAMEQGAGREAVSSARQILQWIAPKVDELIWGPVQGRFVPVILVGGVRTQLFVVRVEGRVAARFMHLRNRPPFNNRKKLEGLLHRMNEIPELNFANEMIDRKPNFPLELLSNPLGMEKFKSAIDWLIAELRTANNLNT